MSEQSPVARVRALCPTCHDLGTVESPLPGMHVLCPTCRNGTRPESPFEPLPFTLPPEPPVSEAEREEGDRLVAEASAPAYDKGAILWAAVDVAADVLTMRRGTHVEFEVPMSLLRQFMRHDDLVPRLVVSFCAGLASGVALLGMLLWLL